LRHQCEEEDARDGHGEYCRACGADEETGCYCFLAVKA
jgi:hypothetical protein